MLKLVLCLSELYLYNSLKKWIAITCTSSVEGGVLNKQVLLRKVWCVSACVVCGLFEGPAVPWMSYFKRCRENVTISQRCWPLHHKQSR